MRFKLNKIQTKWNAENKTDFSDLKAVFLNCTLKKSPSLSHTEGLMAMSQTIMEANGVNTELIRVVDHEVANGVYPDMKEHGWEKDEWPAIQEKVMAANILVIGTPIWLGEKLSIATKVIERLYGFSAHGNIRSEWDKSDHDHPNPEYR